LTLTDCARAVDVAGAPLGGSSTPPRLPVKPAVAVAWASAAPLALVATDDAVAPSPFA
jgi:hypothetical protein